MTASQAIAAASAGIQVVLAAVAWQQQAHWWLALPMTLMAVMSLVYALLIRRYEQLIDVLCREITRHARAAVRMEMATARFDQAVAENARNR